MSGHTGSGVEFEPIGSSLGVDEGGCFGRIRQRRIPGVVTCALCYCGLLVGGLLSHFILITLLLCLLGGTLGLRDLW